MWWLNTKHRQSIPWATFASEPFCCVSLLESKRWEVSTLQTKKDVLFLSFKFIGEIF